MSTCARLPSIQMVRYTRLNCQGYLLPTAINRRYDYVYWVLEEANVQHPLFINECDFSIWTSTSNGRSPLGDQAFRKVCGQKDHISICLAIPPEFGLVYHTIKTAGMSINLFRRSLRVPAKIWMKLQGITSFLMEHEDIEGYIQEKTS